MAQEQLQTARDLLKQKRYDEARVLLKTIDHPKAREWLQTLDTIAPEQKPLTTPKSPSSRNNGMFAIILTVLVIVALGIALYGAFLRPGITAQAGTNDVTQVVRNELKDVTARVDKVETNIAGLTNPADTLQAIRDDLKVIKERVDKAETNLSKVATPADVAAAVQTELKDITERMDKVEASVAKLANSTTNPNNKPTKWEYKTVEITGRAVGPFGSIKNISSGNMYGKDIGGGISVQEASPELLQFLNDMGEGGWELVNFTYKAGEITADLVFKRPQQ